MLVRRPLNPGESISVSISLNGNEVGTIIFDDSNSAGDTLQLTSFPHVREGDVITFSLSGSGTADLLRSDIIDDTNAANITADLNTDGVADMFEEDRMCAQRMGIPQRCDTNFNWYRMRAVLMWFSLYRNLPILKVVDTM